MIIFGDVIGRNNDVFNFISKYFYSKKVQNSRFTDIIKFVTIFVKTVFNLNLGGSEGRGGGGGGNFTPTIGFSLNS